MCIRDGEKLAKDPEFMKNFEGIETDEQVLEWLAEHIEDEAIRREVRYGFLFGRLIDAKPAEALAVAVGTWWHDYDTKDGNGKIKLDFLPTPKPSETDDEQS